MAQNSARIYTLALKPAKCIRSSLFYSIAIAGVVSLSSGFIRSLAAQTPPANFGALEAGKQFPHGRLPDAAIPNEYRIDLTILPDEPSFKGHVEIDVTVKASADHLYLHGRSLDMRKALAIHDGRSYAARWTQVDPTGVARIDFASRLPAGKTTLVFDYSGNFNNSAAGLYREQVGTRWYSWTFFESINARAAFPSFDEPRFKTPFKTSITTLPANLAVSNEREVAASPDGELITHRFAPTRPLPTYLVFFGTGPFAHSSSTIPGDAERSEPLPLGILATQVQSGRLQFVEKQTPRILKLLENYFDSPFPFSKLDQIASAEQPGGMENAGADTYNDRGILLDADASVEQQKHFGVLVSHELSHQWFGDLVTPSWWDDIWLNESFANWMGYRIGDAWQPNLQIAVSRLPPLFNALDLDALEVGRPIHQSIVNNNDIDSAFDEITYSKGAQVVSMIASYMGDDLFRSAVRLHMMRHAYENSTTDQFFASLSEVARDPRVAEAMRSFVDRSGVPLVRITRVGLTLQIHQSRYAFLGAHLRPQHWIIPLCLNIGADRRCLLLDHTDTSITAPMNALIVPNAGGTGYYRFELPNQVACPIFCTSGIVSVARFLFHLNSRSRGCGEVASA